MPTMLKDFVFAAGAAAAGILAVGILFEYADDLPIVKQAKGGF